MKAYFPDQQFTFESSGFTLDTGALELEMTGGIVAVGGNGSGKSTWARGIAGLLQTANPASEPWLYVPQSMGQFFIAETLREQLDYLFPQGYDASQMAVNLEKLGLDRKFVLDYPLRWLSGGERRRTALACALYLQPRYLILDEPTIGLSPKEALWVNEYLNILQMELTGFLIISHTLDVIAHRATVLGFEAGRIIHQGPVPEFLGSPELIQRFRIRSLRAGA